jgi:hypothetical protein
VVARQSIESVGGSAGVRADRPLVVGLGGTMRPEGFSTEPENLRYLRTKEAKLGHVLRDAAGIDA